MHAVLLTLLLVPIVALGHGDSPSLEAEVHGYVIDIGYEDLAPRADVIFDIDLYRSGPPLTYADFARVDLRVTRDGTEIVAGSVENNAEKIPTFTVNFPESGGYDIDVRFLNAADILIAARTFHLEVPTAGIVMFQDGLEWLHYALAAGLFALSLGIGSYALWERFRR